MVQIKRGSTPNILLKNPRLKSYCNHTDVTTELNRMQFAKCGYCEKNIKDGAQVDHYIPLDSFVIRLDKSGKKIYDWHLANDWNNLIYSCSKCNNAKKKNPPFKHGIRKLINPTIVNPERFIDFDYSGLGTAFLEITIIPKNSSKIGKSTIEILKLNTRKRDHLGPLALLANELDKLFIQLLLKLTNGTDIDNSECQSIISKFKSYMLSNQTYSGFSRSFIKKRIEYFVKNEKRKIEAILGYNINLGIEIPKGVKI